jgi:EmrB/QacA subfamily drug resistance transporter
VSEVTEGGVRLATPAGKWVLAATVLGSGVVSLDATVVNVALPRLAEDLDASFAGLQWVITGYTLTLASLILLGGALGDRYGRRRLFSIGLVWFALASALCAVAPNVGVLVAARALQGIGGALLTPGSLAIISASFHPDDRGRAIGAWSGLGGVTTAIGPFLGGWLVDISWRWIFLLNLPLAAFVFVLTQRHVPESRDANATSSPDVSGAGLCVVGLAAITYALIDEQWLVAVIGLVALAGFVMVEMRSRHPMMPLDVFDNPTFRAINLLTFVIYGALAMTFFLLALVLQVALGYSPIAAGSSLVPVTAIMLVFSARAGALAQRVGPRLPLTIGPAVIAAGLLLFTQVEPGTSYLTGVLPAVLVFGGGLALTVAPLTAAVLAAAEPRHAGLASGVNNAVARVAGLVAVAAVPLLTGFDASGQIGAGALVDGFHTAVLVAAGLCAAGAAMAAATIKPERPAPATEPPEPCFHCGADAPPVVIHSS